MKSMERILKDTELSPGNKLVLLALTLKENDEDLPTIRAIAQMTGLTERSVITQLQTLVEMGVVEKIKKSKTNYYKIFFV
jgi:Fic family protein